MGTNGDVKDKAILCSTDAGVFEELRQELDGYVQLQMEKALQRIMFDVEQRLDQTIEQTLQPLLWELSERHYKVSA